MPSCSRLPRRCSALRTLRHLPVLIAACTAIAAPARADVLPRVHPLAPSGAMLRSASPASIQSKLLSYYGGPVLANVKVVMVDWTSSVDTTVSANLPNFYAQMLASTADGMFFEYSTSGVTPVNHTTSTEQTIGHGTYAGAYTITPSANPDTITNAQIQTELAQQLASFHLPQPDANTLYMINFPPGHVIGGPGGVGYSCQDFCTFHDNFMGPALMIRYAVLPDYSTCDACGARSLLDRATLQAWRALAACITDPDIETSIAWYNTADGEISDFCPGSGNVVQYTPVSTTWTIQALWSNCRDACVLSWTGADCAPASTASSTSLASAPQPSTLGQHVSLTATVTPGGATGTVRFFDGSTSLGTATVSGGTAVLNTSALALGTHTLTATYGGDPTTDPSTSTPVTQRVIQPTCLDAGLVAWWRGEGNAVDSAGTHDGVLQGGVTFAPGKVGETFSLDGFSGDVSVPNDAAFDFIDAITIEAWIRIAAGDNRYIVTKNEDSFYLAVGPLTPNRLSFWLNGVSSGWLVGTTDLTDTQWHHVAGTYDGSFLRVYVDGHLENSAAASGTILAGTSPVLIGTRPSDNSYFPGFIDELAIYDRALSASEIQAIYANGPAGRCDLVAVGDAPTRPTPFEFVTPWPNPSERATNIAFQLPARTTVRVEVVDVAGRLVSSLADRAMDAGAHAMRWDGRDSAGHPVAPGVYLVRVAAGAAAVTHRVVVIR